MIMSSAMVNVPFKSPTASGNRQTCWEKCSRIRYRADWMGKPNGCRAKI
jgi:hypothetical protein